MAGSVVDGAALDDEPEAVEVGAVEESLLDDEQPETVRTAATAAVAAARVTRTREHLRFPFARSCIETSCSTGTRCDVQHHATRSSDPESRSFRPSSPRWVYRSAPSGFGAAHSQPAPPHPGGRGVRKAEAVVRGPAEEASGGAW
jgi:hypothetical protein